MSLRINWRPLRKVVAGALTGLTTTGVLTVLPDIGSPLAALVVAAASTVAAYVTPDPRADTRA